MPTDTFAIASDADDGTGYRTAASWATIGAGTFVSEETTNLWCSKTTNGTDFFVDETYLRFDTSSLTANAAISAANLLLHVVSKGANANGITYGADYYDFGGEPSVAADWVLPSPANAITSWSPDSLTVGIVNTIALTGLSGISKTGITGLRLAPLDGAAPTSSTNNIEFAASEAAQQEPRLEVTYEIVGDITTRRYQIRRSRGTSW